MTKQEALAKARAAKKAKTHPGSAGNGTHQQDIPDTAAIYYPEMSDEEVIIFCNRYLKGKTVAQVTDTNHLEALVRYGAVMSNRREAAEDEGRAAKLKMVKREVGLLEKRFATASLLSDLANENQKKLAVGHPADIPFEMVLRVAGEELVISLETVYADHGTGQQVTVFAKIIQDIAKSIMSGCTRQYHLVNTGGGESFNVPFDFQTYKTELRNQAMPKKWIAE